MINNASIVDLFLLNSYCSSRFTMRLCNLVLKILLKSFIVEYKRALPSSFLGVFSALFKYRYGSSSVSVIRDCRGSHYLVEDGGELYG